MFDEIIRINRLVKTSSRDKVRSCFVQRLRYTTPNDPAPLPKIGEDGAVIEEEDATIAEKQAQHDKMVEELSLQLKETVEDHA